VISEREKKHATALHDGLLRLLAENREAMRKAGIDWQRARTIMMKTLARVLIEMQEED